MQRIISASRQFIQEVDNAALSDQEESCASYGYKKMAKLSINNMPKQFMDDSEVCTPASSCRATEVRKALKNALKKQCSQEQDDQLGRKIGGFEITLENVSSEEDTNDCSSNDGSKMFNDAASAFSHGAFSNMSKFEESAKNSFEEEVQNERRLTQAERESFFAPKPVMKTNIAEFKPSSKVFQPTAAPAFLMPCTHAHHISEQEYCSEENMDVFEPAYKQKEKTEMCKFYLNGQDCKFGAECAFAHGEHELMKKTHVASKFRMTLCNSYMTGDGFCQYGVRCQFSHTSRDFSDFHEQRTRYQNLLNENATIMKSRCDQVADPDISQFNIAMPSKGRLAIFENICPEATKDSNKSKKAAVKTNKNKAGQNKQRTSRKVNFVKQHDQASFSSMKLSSALGFN